MKNLDSLKISLENLCKNLKLDEEIIFQIANDNDFDLQINNFVKYQNFTNAVQLNAEIKKIISKDKNILDFQITHNYFINLKLDLKNFINVFENIETYLISDKVKKIILDYGGPNIGKPLHVGHLRSLNIGRSLYKINEYAGNKVVSDIHLGDWGMPVAQIIGYCDLKNINIKKISIEELEIIYPEASKLYEEDKEFMILCQEINQLLNIQNQEIILKWKQIKKVSLQSIKNRLKELDHSFDLWFGESDVNNLIPKMLEDFKKQKKISYDKGAYISNEDTDPKILITKSDGSYLYLTTDLATFLHRVKNNNFDKTLYVVDKRQSLHFKQLISSTKYFGFEDKDLEHVSFGTVNDIKGNPFKTREGGTKQLKELFIETCDHIKKINSNLDNDSVEILANTVLTYSDLITNRKTDYKFDLERFTNINGKTGIYVQYALVRAKKLVIDSMINFNEETINLSAIENCDKDLLRSFLKFEKYFELAISNNEPHYLADYLYELSNLYNAIYQSENILNNKNNDKKISKILISKLFINYSSLLMDMLGIRPVEKM
tara:strand:- start:579 stop:2222 length:1644 start_codon:yes stop_codon:yes gene_type:complete